VNEPALGAAEDQDLDLRAKRLEDLWDRCAASVYAYAARRIGPDRAGDVVSETFLVAWRRLDDVSGIDLPWLYGVARNVVRQDIRSSSRNERLRAAVQASGTTRSAEEDALTNLGVVDALACLSELDAEIVLLTAWEGLDSKAIGSIVGLSAPAVRMRLSRAKRALVTFDKREEMEP